MKHLIVFLCCIAMIVFCAIQCIKICNQTAQELDAKTTNIINQVGKKVIINKDTLLIMDYSLLNQNYTLSNGVKISFEFEEKAVLK